MEQVVHETMNGGDIGGGVDVHILEQIGRIWNTVLSNCSIEDDLKIKISDGFASEMTSMDKELKIFPN